MIEESRREGIEELVGNCRRTALATVHVNHPGAAFKLMRQLAEYSLDVCDVLTALMKETERAENSNNS